MNSLNLITGRISAPQSPGPSRSNSFGRILSSATPTEVRRNSRDALLNEKSVDLNLVSCNQKNGELLSNDPPHVEASEEFQTSHESRWAIIPKRVSFTLLDSIRWIFSTLAAPGIYIIASLYDEKGCFAPVSQIAKFGMIFCRGSRRASTAQILGLSCSSEELPSVSNQDFPENGTRETREKNDSRESSALSPSSESETNGTNVRPPSSRRQRIHLNFTQMDNSPVMDGDSPSLKQTDEAHARHPLNRKAKSAAARNNNQKLIGANTISPSSLKSPVSPASSSLSFIPKSQNVPAPPRPLIPRNYPPLSRSGSNGKSSQKTLILDLDETLIHSMAKCGRMNTGHMVEVRLNTIVAAGGNSMMGLQHPILYWVNKRPHCDEFLRRVCKWYKLVIFTASVQEYADPVIDFLEQERKLFTGRYYRQHCTYRHGSFIKDLSSIEPDLSKVMILDNSPLSYMFHQENAIPIEGWINDPTDNNLLHLVPLLESLQYVTDVRAFLALRGGENGKYL